ncbi:MAG TPA: helix-turn-helix transcriptional regulator [Firmicutes bacterium]|nr:helix-turn-helix transcriptional regulator [Bacillota bacterium]
MPRTLMERQAELLKALGHPARLFIVQMLAEAAEAAEAPDEAERAGAAGAGEKCVCEIIPALGMEQSSVSKHLAVLRERGVVEVRREGTRMFYRLTDRRVMAIVRLAREICVTQLAQAQRMLAETPQQGRQALPGGEVPPA